MKPITCFLICILFSAGIFAQGFSRQVNGTMDHPGSDAPEVKVVYDDNGVRLVVNGKDFMVNGMNWDYFPIGTNFSYSLWNQSDEFIKSALDAEMSLLRNMG